VGKKEEKREGCPTSSAAREKVLRTGRRVIFGGLFRAKQGYAKHRKGNLLASGKKLRRKKELQNF